MHDEEAENVKCALVLKIICISARFSYFLNHIIYNCIFNIKWNEFFP
jgi:hypothetical protein